MVYDPGSVAPRRRGRPAADQIEVMPRPRSRPSPVERTIIKDALPLGVLQKTHNGYVPKVASEQPDPRFAPLIIVMDPKWRAGMPGWVAYRVERMREWTPDTDWTKGDDKLLAVQAYLTETALRQYIGRSLLDQATYRALELALCKRERDGELDKFYSGMIVNHGHRLEVDMTKSTGPFYLDGVLAIEHHYAEKLSHIR